MSRKVWWALLIILAVLYSFVVWGWIKEGSQNFERQRQEQEAQQL